MFMPVVAGPQIQPAGLGEVVGGVTLQSAGLSARRVPSGVIAR
jgi:hypothetical protein